MNKFFNTVTALMLLLTVSCTSVGTPPQKRQTAERSVSSYWTGDGGKGRSITILPPKGSGLVANQAYLPDLVANELLSNFSSFSAMTPFDRVNNQRQYDELLSGYYANDDKAGLDLGHLASTDYMLLGDITRTSTGYALQLTVNRNSNKTTVAAYSGTVTIAELDNLTGVRRASLDLLQKMGVQLTAQARTELTRAATSGHVNAQTAMAQGIVAQRGGTEVAALSYFYQAATFDSSLLEAVNRGSVMSASITSGNIGDNVRNDIQWRKDWIARLTSTEEYFDNFFKASSLPYTLFYSTAISQGTINYQTETVTLGIDVNLRASGVWINSVERALQAVYQGLDATKRKNDWRLEDWPDRGVTNLRPFASGNKTFTAAAELVNERNQVIGRQNINVKGDWGWRGVAMRVSNDDRQTVNFTVKADDITDRMTIRIASVNGVDAQTAARNGVLQTRALSGDEWSLYRSLNIDRGVLTGANINGTTLVIPTTIWDEPVITIGYRAFENKGLTSVTIPNSITSIGEGAFANNRLTSVIIPNGVLTIGDRAFAENHWTTNHRNSDDSSYIFHYGLRRVTIADSVTSVGQRAFGSHWTTTERISGALITVHNWLVTEVTIGANVTLGKNAIGNGFEAFYTKKSKQAGAYRARDTYNCRWIKNLKYGGYEAGRS